MSFGLTPACVRRITTPRPQSNKNLLPATSTRMAEPNRSAFGKGVPVPSNVTRIWSEGVAVEMLSSMHSERNRTINDTKRAKCGVWVASPLQGEGEGEGFLEDNWCAETPKTPHLSPLPLPMGRGEKAGTVGFISQTANQSTRSASSGGGGCFTCAPLFDSNSSWVSVRSSSCTSG